MSRHTLSQHRMAQSSAATFPSVAMARFAACALACLLSTGMLSACAHPQAVVPRPTAAGIAAAITIDTLQVDAKAFAEPFKVRVFLPPGYANEHADNAARYPVLYVNDGQDMEAVGMLDTLARSYADGSIRPLIVVAVDMPRDRMGGYGLSDRAGARSVVAETKYGPVGTHAHAYSEWVATALVPLVDARYRTLASPDARAILGWSLGALNAFNLAWQYPEVFGTVGGLSPSFWLSRDRTDAAAIQRTRLVHDIVDTSKPRHGLKVFFALGTDEETDDRDGDGVIDAIDDARDLIEGWKAGDGTDRMRKGLRQLGYSVNLDHATKPNGADVAFLLLPGGEHNQASWARELPGFLRWAYATRALKAE